ncbi:hypothetical protein U1Q18_000688 [Sarracenia purpurea var. burkii]
MRTAPCKQLLPHLKTEAKEPAIAPRKQRNGIGTNRLKEPEQAPYQTWKQHQSTYKQEYTQNNPKNHQESNSSPPSDSIKLDEISSSWATAANRIRRNLS